MALFRHLTGLGISLLLITLLTISSGSAKELVVALNQDPDVIDPSLGRTYVGRIIFANMCEKLYDIDENLNISPQLAAAMPKFSNGGRTVDIALRKGVKFNDGTPFTAAAVKYTLNRHQTLKGSNRKSELKLIEKVEAVNDHLVRISLSKSFSPIVGAFVDRSGMPISPSQGEKMGDKFGLEPICVGPFSLTERVPQDRIVLEKSPHYFDQSAAQVDKITFRIIPKDSVRVANLRSGDIDIMHQVSPTDAKSLKSEGKFQVTSATGMGYQGITVNIHNKTGKRAPQGDLGTPLANDPRVREALELSIDRDALNQVVFEGAYTPGCTPLSPVSPFFDKGKQCTKRDIAKAKQLLAAAGVSTPYELELMVVNNPVGNRVGQVVQSMAAEAGFKISLRPQEFASALKDYDAGKYTAFQIGWSGRVRGRRLRARRPEVGRGRRGGGVGAPAHARGGAQPRGARKASGCPGAGGR